MKKFLLALFVCAGFIIGANAQGFDALSNPKVLVKIAHPPGLGIKINKVVFNPATGINAEQITDVLISDFVNNGG